jgi:positive regulator of sigma E activity
MFWKDARGLGEIPVSSKIAVTGFLVAAGIGYLLGFANIYLTYSPVDEKPGMSVEDIAFAFYGKREATKLEKSIDGSMKSYFKSDGDYRAVKAWLSAGAGEAGFVQVKPIFDSSCSMCHSTASKVANVVTETYADLRPLLAQDTGKSVARLVGISHTHMLATAPLLFLLAFVFAFARYPERLKVAVMSFASLAILLDIGSWWLARLSAGLAVLVIIGGVSLALSFAAFILLSLADMWLRRQA